MRGKLSQEAFYHYYGLGEGRSYQAVATEYGVSKTAVVNRARKERWQDRVDELDRKAQERADEKALETVDEMTGRHLKLIRVIQGRGLEALKSMPLSSAMDAVRALDLAIKQERLIRGEPSDRTAVSVEEVIKKEYERWMEPAGNGRESDADDDW